MSLAAVDVGSNSVRLLVGDVLGGKVLRLRHERAATRLADGISRTGRLAPQPMAMAVEALKRYREIVEAAGAGRVKAVGTSALREAENAGEFLARARSETGFDIEVVTGREEADLSALGVISSLPVGPSSLIVDIGGGSTEAVLVEGGRVSDAVSVPVGVVKLLDCIRHDPPSDGDVRALDAAARTAARQLAVRLKGKLSETAELIATAGTATTLAAIDLGLVRYETGKVHGHTIAIERLRGMWQSLSAMALAERRAVRGLEPARADLIITGIKLTINLMETLGFGSMRTSDQGLLEGVLIKLSTEVSR